MVLANPNPCNMILLIHTRCTAISPLRRQWSRRVLSEQDALSPSVQLCTDVVFCCWVTRKTLPPHLRVRVQKGKGCWALVSQTSHTTTLLWHTHSNKHTHTQTNKHTHKHVHHTHQVRHHHWVLTPPHCYDTHTQTDAHTNMYIIHIRYATTIKFSNHHIAMTHTHTQTDTHTNMYIIHVRYATTIDFSNHHIAMTHTHTRTHTHVHHTHQVRHHHRVFTSPRHHGLAMAAWHWDQHARKGV